MSSIWGHSRTRVCRHEVSNWKGEGLGARDLCVCTGADRGCTCQRECDSRTFDRSEDCGKGTVPVDLSENASRIQCQNIYWNSFAVKSRRNDTCARLLCDAGRADATGASGPRPQECACSTDGVRRLAPRSNSGRAHAAGDTGWNSKTLNGLQTSPLASTRS